MQINLNDLTNNGEVHNLSGHDRGHAARVKYGIAKLDQEDDAVVVMIPDYIYSITSSFFQGMFAESVRHFGDRDSFLLKYKFDADTVVLQQIEKGIEASLFKRDSLFD